MAVAKTFQEILEGSPVDPSHEVVASQLRKKLEELEAQAALNGGLYFEDTLANLNAVTGMADGDSAFVLDDGTASNNGVYLYGSSTWTKTADLPAAFTDAVSALADIAALDASLHSVAKSGDYDELENLPTLGTAAATASTDYATAAQGAKADSAVQPGDLGSIAYDSRANYATASQGVKADGAAQSADLGTASTADSGAFATALQGANADAALAALTATGQTYPTQAAGLASTSDGAYFIVHGEAGSPIYENDGGAAVLSGYSGTGGNYYASRTAATAATVPTTFDMIFVKSAGGLLLSYTRDASGTALTTSGAVKWSPLGDVYADHFGDNTTPGTTSMSAIIQAAVDWMGANSTLHFERGAIYRVDTTIDITEDDVMIDDAGVVFDASNITLSGTSNVPDAVFHVSGSNRSSSTLSVAASEDDLTVTVVSTGTMAVGDVVEFDRYSSGTPWYHESGNAVDRYCVNKITAISGNNITLAWPIDLDLDIGNPVNSWNTVKRFRTTGGEYQGGGVRTNPIGNGIGSSAFYLTYAEDCHIEIGYIEGFQGFGIRFEQYINCSAHGGMIRGLTDSYGTPVESEDSGFYGVFPVYGHGFSWSDTTCHRCRHSQDGSFGWNISFSNIRSYRAHRPGMGSHSGLTNVVYTNCFSDDDVGGMLWRGHSVKLIGCTIRNATLNGSGFYDTAGAAADVPKKIELIGNSITAHRYAVNLNSNIGYFKSVANTYENRETNVSYDTVVIDALDLNSFSMVGDTVIGNGCNYGVYFKNVTPRSRNFISITDCQITGYASRPVRVFRAATGTDVIYKDNRVDGDDRLNIDAGTGVTVDGPNYYSGNSVGSGNSGTWTPAVTDGTNAVTLSTASGWWVNAGGIVTASFRVTASSLGSASGAIKITGLPKAAVTDGAYVAVGAAVPNNTSIASEGDCKLRINSGADEIELRINDTAGGTSALQASELTASGTLQGSISYQV